MEVVAAVLYHQLHFFSCEAQYTYILRSIYHDYGGGNDDTDDGDDGEMMMMMMAGAESVCSVLVVAVGTSCMTGVFIRVSLVKYTSNARTKDLPGKVLTNQRQGVTREAQSPVKCRGVSSKNRVAPPVKQARVCVCECVFLAEGLLMVYRLQGYYRNHLYLRLMVFCFTRARRYWEQQRRRIDALEYFTVFYVNRTLRALVCGRRLACFVVVDHGARVFCVWCLPFGGVFVTCVCLLGFELFGAVVERCVTVLQYFLAVDEDISGVHNQHQHHQQQQ